MTKSVKRIALAFATVTLLAMALAAPALALESFNYYDKGITERQVWDTVQCAAYKINVTHIGTMHMELTWKNPNWADFDVYILDTGYGSVFEEPMGYQAQFTGKEIIDHYISGISPEGSAMVDPDGSPGSGDERLKGDDYYVLVVAFNEKAQWQLWGYTPQSDVSAGTSPSAQWNFYYDTFRKPGGKTDWGWLAGAPYGGAYDFRPTSLGTVECRLEWPADRTNKTITYDPVEHPKPAEVEQYLFSGSEWRTVIEHYSKPDNWKPKAYPTGLGNLWYGLKDTFNLIEGSPSKAPQLIYHYTPSLMEVAADDTMGQFGGPYLGGLYSDMTGAKSSLSVKATFIYPENLRISAPAKVKKGTKVTLKGTYALVFKRDPDGTPASGDEFNERAWAPNTKITVQWRPESGGSWKNMTSATTDENGKWSKKVTVKKTGWWRAKAAGVDETGLATEFSAKKRIRGY